MGEIRLDTYPFRRWFVEGTTELPNYSVLKKYLVEQFRVCYFCKVPVFNYPQIDGQRKLPDTATIEHLTPRPYRKRGDLSVKVLCCDTCNSQRNRKNMRVRQKLTAQPPKPNQEGMKE